MNPDPKAPNLAKTLASLERLEARIRMAVQAAEGGARRPHPDESTHTYAATYAVTDGPIDTSA